MQAITVSEELYARVVAFKQIVDALLEEEIGPDECAALILGQGMDAMLADILGPVDQPSLVRSFQLLGSQYPAQVYGFAAETLKGGAAAQERERIRRRLGFHPRAEIGS